MLLDLRSALVHESSSMSNRATVVPHAVDIFLLCIVHQKKHIM